RSEDKRQAVKAKGKRQKTVGSRQQAVGSRELASRRLRLNRFVPVVVLLTAYCLLPTAYCFLFAQTTTDTTTQPASNLHQWGAVTLFHGLPSDRVRALAQDAEGALWFGTDNGLARYDG